MHVKIVWLGVFVRLLAVRTGPDPGTELASVNLFPIVDYLAQPWYSGTLLQVEELTPNTT